MIIENKWTHFFLSLSKHQPIVNAALTHSNRKIVVALTPKHFVANAGMLGPSGWCQGALAAHLQRQSQMTAVPRKYSSAVLRDLLSWDGTWPQGSVVAPLKRLSGVP